jgi:hypothetical protein
MEKCIVRSGNMSERGMSALRSGGRLFSPTTGGGAFDSSATMGMENSLPRLISC